MDYNSKRTGAEVEAILDSVSAKVDKTYVDDALAQIDNEMRLVEGYAEEVANAAESNAKSYADNAIAEAITNTINASY